MKFRATKTILVILLGILLGLSCRELFSHSIGVDDGWNTKYSNFDSSINFILVIISIVLLCAIILILYSIIIDIKNNRIEKKEKNKGIKNINDDYFETNKDELLKLVEYIILNSTSNSYVNLKKLLSKNLFKDCKDYLEILNLNGWKVIVDNISMLDFKLVEKYENENDIVFKTYLKLELINYTINRNLKIIKGIREEEIVKAYMLTFVKYKNQANDNWILIKKEKI